MKIRVLLAAVLGACAAALAACGSSSRGLIPTANSGPLRSDFEAVAHAAQSGNCTATQAAITKTEQAFAALPANVDSGLQNRLREGIENLRTQALAQCAQSSAQTTSTSSSAKPTRTTGTTKTTSAPPVNHTTSTQTTPPSSTTTPSTGGSTTAPGSGGTPAEPPSGPEPAPGSAEHGAGVTPPPAGATGGGGQEGAK